MYKYPAIKKTIKSFSLKVEAGEIRQGDITVLVGQNGSGKTTLLQILAGKTKHDDSIIEMPKLNVSYKPQILNKNTAEIIVVKDLIENKAGTYYRKDPSFMTEVFQPLDIQSILTKSV